MTPINNEGAAQSAPEKLLNPRQLADWLGVSAAWVYDHTTRKEPYLPVVRLGSLIRFRESEINAWLREQEGPK